ncbi:2'-5' RNA ligase family protein [Neosynechococcus sphagnicola]|uniref:2'-5' RNA ligase family protein n=1 Tax=Neosynechococcus sphagnicola TaxID=1501145 RepID=UPI00056516C8|nr:2'-5' RNA ligase family protein [Neosynechococcus sphagnicola]
MLNTANQRFFIALLLPPAITTVAQDLQQQVAHQYRSRAALRSPPHITLHPPFEWPLSQVDNLVASIQEFAAIERPVPLVLEGFAAFPPRVIYIHVDQTPGLLALQQALQAHLTAQLGITDTVAPQRSFIPHVTIAFRDLTPTYFQVAWAEFQQRSLRFEFLAEEVTLLRHTGHCWQIYQALPLLGKDINY